MFTITINSNDTNFTNISYYINKLSNYKKQSFEKDDYLLADNTQLTITYNKNKIKIKKYKNNTIVGTYGEPSFIQFIDLSSTDVKNIKQFINDSIIDYYKDHYVRNNSISIWIPHGMSPNLHWEFYSTLLKRNTDTVILDENIKEELLDDVKRYIKSENTYNKYGIPYKRVYCLYGPPGTGKSSIIFSLASNLKKNLHILNFGSGITDSGFTSLMTNIDTDAILLLEDIDALFVNREASSTTVSGFLSFSTLLNFLDGSLRKNGLITIMTTNHPERLDPALLRKGRVDYMIKIGYITKYQIEQFAKLYYPKINNKQLEEFTKILVSIKKLTPSILSSFLFINHDKKIEELLKILKKKDLLQNSY